MNMQLQASAVALECYGQCMSRLVCSDIYTWNNLGPPNKLFEQCHDFDLDNWHLADGDWGQVRGSRQTQEQIVRVK